MTAPNTDRVPPPTGQPDESDGAAWGYRAHLDGLRAVAVYLVVAFHSGIDRMSGGFIGVDVFFVLSGYLVTQVLLGDMTGPGRRIDLRRFYARRARRLLPAAAVNLLATAVVFVTIASPLEVETARRATAAAALYVANWNFISVSADYFAADLNLSPVLHYWSLSVEEQFYVVWPLLLLGLLRVGRRAGARQRTVVCLAVVAAGVVSAGWALSLAGDNLDRAYYGTDTRAYQLLAGAALALLPGLVARVRRSPLRPALPLVAAGLLLSVLVLGTWVVDVDPIRRGVLTTVAVCGLLVALEASKPSLVHRALSWSPVVYLGRISYGTYLWHWLVVIVLTREADLSPFATAAVVTVVATGIASLSYQLLENPVRRSAWLDHHRGLVIGVGLVTSLLVGLAIAPLVLDKDDAQTVTIGADGAATVGGPATKTPGEAYFDRFDYLGCAPEATPCTLVEGDGPTAILIGDSHAAMYAPAVREVAERHDLTLVSGLMRLCPWPDAIQYRNAGGPSCRDQQIAMYEHIIPEVDPDIVILAHRPIDTPGNAIPVIDREEGDLTTDEARDAAVDRRVTALVERLREDGRTVVMIEPIPPSPLPLDPRECLSQATIIEECRFVTPLRPTNQEQVMRRLAEEDPGVVSVDLDPVVCPFLPICDPIVNGIIVRLDDNHLTNSFAETLADPLDAYLTEQGVVP